MKLRTVFPCFGQQAQALPRLKCAVLCRYTKPWLWKGFASKNSFYSVVAKGAMCCNSGFPCCVLFVLPLVALPSFALQVCVFILKQLCCVVKTCLFVNGLTACKLCVALSFDGKGFSSSNSIYISCFNKQMPSSYLQSQRLSCYNLLYNVKCSAIQRCRRLFYGDCRDKHIQFYFEAGCR